MIILEIQHYNDGTTSCITSTFKERNLAEQKYHQVLSYAAVSSVDVHSVVMLDDEGNRVKGEPYYHGQNVPADPSDTSDDFI